MIDWVDGWVRLVIVAPTTGLPKIAVEQRLSITSPRLIAHLLSDEGLQVHAAVKLVRLGAWIADPAFVVQVFGNLEALSFVTVYSP